MRDSELKEQFGIEGGKASKNRHLIYFVTITAEAQQTFHKEPQWVYIEVSIVYNRRSVDLVCTRAMCFKYTPEMEHVEKILVGS